MWWLPSAKWYPGRSAGNGGTHPDAQTFCRALSVTQ